jgi:hypothetical protein
MSIQIVASILYIIAIQSGIPPSPDLLSYQLPFIETNQHDDEAPAALTATPTNVTSSSHISWHAKSPWDAPPDTFYNANTTGSFQNCTSTTKTIIPVPQPSTPTSTSNSKPDIDSGAITISCHTIKYKAPSEKIYAAGPILIGVLSAAKGLGPRRRNYIRSTWASTEYTSSVFFLVAGPWDDIKDEFNFYRDIIWIDEEEVYQGEKSVLTFKTVSYFAIAHLLGKPPIKAKVGTRSVSMAGGWQHAIKTDDDSYVNLEKLHQYLLADKHTLKELNYYGQCPQFHVNPSREKTNKWPVSFQMYPEPRFPLYCQGAGFGLSRELVQAAVEGEHIANFRYMPFEDVSIGILTERSGAKYHATMIPGIKVFRADTQKERDCVSHAVPMTECYKGDNTWPPDARMSHHLIQHRVNDRQDMVNIHKSLGLEVHWVKTNV